MAWECLGSERRTMTISVSVLGIALLVVMLAYLAFGDSNDEEALRTVRMISIISRHGDRSPTKLYKLDPHIKHKWHGGVGALSEKGSLQMYNLGKNLRARYYRLLPDNGFYSQDDMQILSSAAERCIMSAQSMLAGFMPPLEHNNPLPIAWQPVAIKAINREMDHLIAQKRPCPKYDETLARLYEKPPHDVQEMNAKAAEMYRILSKNTGENISTILDVELLYSTLEIESQNGLTLPDWTENIFPDKMLSLVKRSYTLFTETAFMKKIKGGALVTEIVNLMIKKRSENLNQSIFIFSGHDVTLVNLFRALKIIDQTADLPEYAATLVFEMHHSNLYPNDFEVKIFYYFNSEDKFPKEISIPDCDQPCSLTNFQRTLGNIWVDDYDEICKLV